MQGRGERAEIEIEIRGESLSDCGEASKLDIFDAGEGEKRR